MDVGSPMQRVNLLLDLETAVAPGGESLSIFSSRLHKSVSMACSDLSPPRQYAQLCQDLALVAPNGSASDQRLVHTTFVFENDQAAYAEAQPAALAGLDGTFRLTRGQTVWLSTTHLCFAPVQPTLTDRPLLLFEVDAQDKLRTRMIDLDVFDPALSFDDRCANTLEEADAPVRLFPIEAANEARVWLTLSGTFLYEYGSDVLEKRRRVVEAGENCSALIEELAHQRDIYHSDCGLGLGTCEVLPSVPYRRFATRRIRIDVPLNGEGSLTAEHADSLKNIKQAYPDALASASARLLVLLLTAAVVFVRGSQNATSSRWLLTNVIDTLRCRHAYSDDITPQNAISRYDTADILTDGIISVAAWGSRLVVLIFAAPFLVADGQDVTLRFQIVGTGVLVRALLSALLPRHQLEARRAHHDARWAHVGHRRHERGADALLGRPAAGQRRREVCVHRPAAHRPADQPVGGHAHLLLGGHGGHDGRLGHQRQPQGPGVPPGDAGRRHGALVCAGRRHVRLARAALRQPRGCGAQPVADGQHERDQVRHLPGPRVHQPAHVYQGVVACVPARV